MTTAYTASNSVPMGAVPATNGIIQTFLAASTNPADATYAPDGLAPAPIFGLGGQQLQGDEIVAGGIATLVSYVGPLLNSGALCWVLLECEGGAQQIANATHNQHAITKGQVQILIAQAVPAGAIIDFAGTTAPTGYLACPTSQTNVSRATYAGLFAAIGTTWGAGDGSTTFGLPWFPADYVSSQANSNVGTRTVGQVIEHTHTDVHNRGDIIAGGGSEALCGASFGSPYPVQGGGGPANLAASVRLLKCVKT